MLVLWSRGRGIARKPLVPKMVILEEGISQNGNYKEWRLPKKGIIAAQMSWQFNENKIKDCGLNSFPF